MRKGSNGRTVCATCDVRMRSPMSMRAYAYAYAYACDVRMRACVRMRMRATLRRAYACVPACLRMPMRSTCVWARAYESFESLTLIQS